MKLPSTSMYMSHWKMREHFQLSHTALHFESKVAIMLPFILYEYEPFKGRPTIFDSKLLDFIDSLILPAHAFNITAQILNVN